MRNIRSRWVSRSALALTVGLAAPATASAQADWCEHDDREDRHCEVREFTLRAGGTLAVDATPNGGIEVSAWDRNEIRVRAKVVARARSDARAEDLASAVTIDTDGTIRADGPRAERNEGWWVSYRIDVPANTDLDLASTNGGVGVAGVTGTMDLSTTNGGLNLRDVGGDVSARTTNGGISVHLAGPRWEGRGLDAVTTNGGIDLAVPDGYSAHLETGTQNGGFDIDFPITVSGRIRRSVSTELGSGGAPVHVRTTNGGVRIRRAG